MEELLGADPLVFLILTVILFGGASFLTGQALAATWRPFWQLYGYVLLLAAAERFLSYALFDAELLSWQGFLLSAILLFVIGAFAYRVTLTTMMVSQYPWLYVRRGLLGWREKPGGEVPER